MKENTKKVSKQRKMKYKFLLLFLLATSSRCITHFSKKQPTNPIFVGQFKVKVKEGASQEAGALSTHVFEFEEYIRNFIRRRTFKSIKLSFGKAFDLNQGSITPRCSLVTDPGNRIVSANCRLVEDNQISVDRDFGEGEGFSLLTIEGIKNPIYQSLQGTNPIVIELVSH